MLKQVFLFFLMTSFIIYPVHAQFGTININKDLVPKKPNQTDPYNKPVKDLTVPPIDQTYQIPGGQGIPKGFSMSQFRQEINVHVLGEVINPGVYKAQVSDRAADIVKMAGINRQTLRMIQIRHPGEKTRYYDLYQYFYFGNLKHNPYLKDNDTIFVPKQRGAVRIEGPVARPGTYELNYEKNLYQIVQLSGGFTAAMSKMHPLKVIRFSDGGQKFVLDVVQTKSTLKNFEIKRGDVIIVPDVINVAKDFDYTIETIPGENLVYPTSVPDVFVIGAVRQPGPYPYKSHLTVKDYLGYSGASETAKLTHVTILRDGKKKRSKLHDKVYAGDVVIVKEKNLNTFLKTLGIFSTILSVTLTALVLKKELD